MTHPELRSKPIAFTINQPSQNFMQSSHCYFRFPIALAICLLLSVTACKRSPSPTPAENTPNASAPAASEISEQPALEQAANHDTAAVDKYRSASSALEPQASDSANKTVCKQSKYGDSEDPSEFCECGDIIIPGGTECIDSMPACKGHKAVTAIPGFGCVKNEDDEDKNIEDRKVEYLCGLSWGCDLGNGKKCKYTQKLVNGECVSTVDQPKGDFVCEEGNCACGDGFCALGAKCVAGKCECGHSESENICMTDEEWAYNHCEADGCDRCQSHDVFGIISQYHGEFVCDYWLDGGSSATSEVYYHQCDNPDGCTIGNMHFARGTMDYTGSSTSPSGDFRSWDLDYVDRLQYGCPYHIDGDTDTTTETLCPMGDCVIPKKDGHCSTIGMDPSAFHKVKIDHGNDHGDEDGEQTIYNAEACPGGTRWCHGRNNAPEKAPSGDSHYGCYDIPRHGDSVGLRAWVCDDPAGCICGDELCQPKLVCTNNHCVSQKDYIERAGKIYKTEYPKETEGRPIYDPNFYTTDPAELNKCGRKSAEEFVQKWSPSIDISAISKYVGHEIAFDPCLTRHICDSWPVPRKDRDKYVCEHGLYAQKTADGRMIFADRPLGLRCIAPDECPCGQRYGMNFTAKSGELCISSTYDAGSSSFYDSVSQYHKCKWEIGKEIESQYKFWHNYIRSVDPKNFSDCIR